MSDLKRKQAYMNASPELIALVATHISNNLDKQDIQNMVRDQKTKDELGLLYDYLKTK